MYSRPEGGSKGNSFGTFLDTLKRNEQTQQQTQQAQQTVPPSNGSSQAIDHARIAILYTLAQPETDSLEVGELMTAIELPLEEFTPALKKLVDRGLVAKVAAPGGKKKCQLTSKGKEYAADLF